MHLLRVYFLCIITIACYAGPIEDIASMPDLSLVSFHKFFFRFLFLLKYLNFKKLN